MRGAILTFTDVQARVLRNYAGLRSSASLAQFSALVDGDLCAGLGVHVEDYSKWFLLEENLVRSLQFIDEYISLRNKCGEIEKEFLKTFVNDILIFGCITISKTIDEKPNSLHPGQYTFEKEVNRMYIQILSGEMMGSCLSEICFCLIRRPVGVNLGGSTLLSHIKIEEYTTEMPIAQRMLLISLCNLSFNLRATILSDPLFIRLKSSPNLVAWILACSGSDEQYFLNTCDTASSCVSLIARHSTICSLLVFARTVLREIRAQSDTLSDTEPAFPSIWPASVPSVRAYTYACSNEAERLFNNIETQASLLLLLDGNNAKLQTDQKENTELQEKQDLFLEASQLLFGKSTRNSLLQFTKQIYTSDTNLQPDTAKLQTNTETNVDKPKTTSWHLPISPEQYLTKLSKLTKEWNHAMQVLSSVYSPSSPIVLTRKPFSERWHLSALVMWVLCSMTKYIPGQPTAQARTRSSHEISQIKPHLYHTFRTQVTQYEDNCVFQDFAASVRAAEPKQQSKLIKFLWKKTIKRGGILFSSREYVSGVGWVGHLNVLFAFIHSANNYVPEGADVAELQTNFRKKLFLIADPEIRNFKILNFLQFFEILCNEDYNFNLLDVGRTT